MLTELWYYNDFIWAKTFCANFYDVFLVAVIANRMLGYRFRELLKFFFHFFITCCAYTFVIRNKIFIDILAYIYMMIILLKVMYKRDWYETINFFTLSLGCALVTWIIIKIITQNIFLELDPFLRELALRNICLILILVCCMMIHIDKLFLRIRHYTLSYRLITHNILFITFSVVILFRLNIRMSFLVFTAILVVFTIMNVYTYSRFKLSSQQQMIEINNKSSEIFDSLIVRLRSNLHEEKNRIQAISMLPDLYNNYDDLKLAIQEYTSKSKNTKSIGRYLNIRRKFVAALIIAKVMEAEGKDIAFRVEIKDYAMNSDIDDYRLSEIFGTLIDNAFDEVIDLPYTKEVHLKVSSQFGSLTIELSNPCREVSDAEIKRFFQKGYTTKTADSEQHGIGLFHMHQLVDEFDGTAVVYCKRDHAEYPIMVFKITL